MLQIYSDTKPDTRLLGHGKRAYAVPSCDVPCQQPGSQAHTAYGISGVLKTIDLWAGGAHTRSPLRSLMHPRVGLRVAAGRGADVFLYEYSRLRGQLTHSKQVAGCTWQPIPASTWLVEHAANRLWGPAELAGLLLVPFADASVMSAVSYLLGPRLSGTSQAAFREPTRGGG